MVIPGWNEFVNLIGQVLVFLATLTGSSGLAIIILTIAVKLLLVPLTLSSLRSAKKMQEIQPKIKDLQKKYGSDRQLLSAETMKLYQEHRVNPFGSCLPMIIQMPIFFGLYYSILHIATSPDYANAGFSTAFLWIPNLAQHDALYILPFVVTITQFIQQRMALPQRVPGQQLDQQQQMMNSMMQVMPLMVGFFAWNFAAGPVIYWITQNIFSAVQQYFITGFGSLRDLPGMRFLPVPPWVKLPPPDSGNESNVIVTRSRPDGANRRGGPGAAASQPAAPAEPSGLMGRLYQQINKRVETVEQQRANGVQPRTPGDVDDERPGPDSPPRRSSRRARPKR